MTTPRPLPPAEFTFRHGLALLRGSSQAPAWMHFDERTGAFAAAGHRLPELRRWARARGIPEASAAPEAE